MNPQLINYKGHQIQIEEDGDITVWELDAEGFELGHFLVCCVKEAKKAINEMIKEQKEYEKAMRIFG